MLAFRYRHEFKSDELFREIKYVLERFQAPLLRLFEVALGDLPAAMADAAASKTLVQVLTHPKMTEAQSQNPLIGGS